MNSNLKYYLTFFYILIFTTTFASTETDSIKTDTTFTNICNCIHPENLLGFWVAKDSTKNKIEFAYNQNLFVVREYSTFRPYNYFISFEFINTDSLPFVSTTGIIYKWPPDYCTVRQIDFNNIEIAYSILGAETFFVNYERESVKKK